MSTQITFRRVTPHESRIYQDGDYVGDVHRQPDILDSGGHYYVVHLHEDSRGPLRVNERLRIRDTAAQRLRTHPFYQ